VQVGMQSAMQPMIQDLMQAGMDALVQCQMEVHKLQPLVQCLMEVQKLQPLLQCLIQFHKLQALVLALEVLLHAVIVCPLLLFFQPLSLVCSALHLFHHCLVSSAHHCLVSSAHHWLVCSALQSFHHFFHHWLVCSALKSFHHFFHHWLVCSALHFFHHSFVCSPFPYHDFHWWLLKIYPTVTI
jgi:hypothetical protein